MAEEPNPLEGRRVAAMVNDAMACGMEMNGLDNVLFDYFAIQHDDRDSDTEWE